MVPGAAGVRPALSRGQQAMTLERRWVLLCILWYLCGLATGLLWGGMLAKARGIW